MNTFRELFINEGKSTPELKYQSSPIGGEYPLIRWGNKDNKFTMELNIFKNELHYVIWYSTYDAVSATSIKDVIKKVPIDVGNVSEKELKSLWGDAKFHPFFVSDAEKARISLKFN
jgi:hypothetical protein